MTKQQALDNYYKAIILLEETGVIGHHHGDQLSADMMSEVDEDVEE